MSFDIDPVYVIYLFVALAAGLFVEGIYLLFFNARSYRKNVNRRLRLLDNQPDREGVLVQLRRERGLTMTGDYQLPLVALNRLILQSGLKLGIGKFAIYVGVLALLAFGLVMVIRDDLLEAFGAALFCCTLLPLLLLKFKRGRRQKVFGAQFPDALDIIVRSLRAGHPVPVAINMVTREMADPIGTEFGIVNDEVTYGADLETAMRKSVFPHRPGRPAAIRHCGCDSNLDRRQPRRNPGKPLRGHPPALQDAPQDTRARLRRPRLGDDPVVAADPDVSGHPDYHAAVLCQRLERGFDQDLPRRPAPGC